MNIPKKKLTQILLVIIVILIVVFLIMLFAKRGDKSVEPGLGLSISWTEGNVLFSGNGEIWEVADDTALLTSGYRIRTGKDSKVILQTPQGSVIRLNENTEINIVVVHDHEVLIVQNAGRTYHRVKMNEEDIYQVRALNHTIKAVGTAFDISTNRKANRINVKVLEGKLNLAVNLGEIIEVQSIGKGREITIDPESANNMITLADISRDYAESDWMDWNRQEDMKIGYAINMIEDLLAEEDVKEDEIAPKTTSTTPKTTITTTPKTTAPVTGECKPYLTGKKSAAYKGILLNWSTCSNEDFQFYKVVRSTVNTNPSYPNDPVITSSSNRSYSNYIDKTVAPTRTYYYKVCAVQRLNKISCGNKVSVAY